MTKSNKAWRCVVCGYVHYGAEPPESCPICGAVKGDFETYVEDTPVTPKTKGGQWVCMVCQYVYDGTIPPDRCPICGASSDRFELVAAKTRKSTFGKTASIMIVGGGIAGVSAAEAARQASFDARIILVSKEGHLPYYRLNLTRYLAGEIQENELPIHPESWYAENRIELMRDAEVLAFSVTEKRVELSGGEKIAYNKLILTTGAHPFIPPFQGTNKNGVISIRTRDDVKCILETIQKGMKCVCIGGGILGIETAAALAKHGVVITLLEGFPWLMPRQLNKKGGEILGRYLEKLGIKLHLPAKIKEIQGEQEVSSVLLEDGTKIPADMVVITTGIRSNTNLGRKEGLAVNSGILVDRHLATSNPDVFAAGDVAEYQGNVYGLWGPAQYQGSIAGTNAAGVLTEFGGIPRSNTLKVLGIKMLSIGQFEPKDASDLTISRDTEDAFAHFLFHDAHLMGAILIGDTSISPQIKKAVETRMNLSHLLQKSPTATDVFEYFKMPSSPM